MPESGVVPDVQILAEKDKREERRQLPLKADLTDEPVHGYRGLSAVRITIFFHPAQVEFTPDRTGSRNQSGGIHVQIFSTMEVAQKTDAAEEIAGEMFKR